MKRTIGNRSRHYYISWWQWVLGIDLSLVTITVVGRYLAPGSAKDFFFHPFNLAAEMNIAVWWSGIGLLTVAMLSYEVFCLKKDETKVAWLFLSIMFLALSFDEIGSVHERVGWLSNWRERLPLLPLPLAVAFAFAYCLMLLFKRSETRNSAVLIFYGILLFLSVAFQEYLELRVVWPVWARGIRAGVEEGTELLGVFMILAGVVNQRCWRVPDSLRAVVPNPALMKYLPSVLLVGLFCHSLASLFVPGITDVGEQGNPLVWYPMAVYFLLFSASFWNAVSRADDNRRDWAVLSILLLAYSVGTNFNLFLILHGLDETISYGHLLITFYVGLLLLVLFLAFKDSARFSKRGVVLVSALLTLSLGNFVFEMVVVQFMTSGLFAYLVAMFLFDTLSAGTFERHAAVKSSE